MADQINFSLTDKLFDKIRGYLTKNTIDLRLLSFRRNWHQWSLFPFILLFTGCTTMASDSQSTHELQTKEPPQGISSISKNDTSANPGQITPEQVLTIFRDFLHDDRVTVAEVTRRLIGNDIPVSPSNENISVGTISLWKKNKGLWYLNMERRSLRPGYFKDGIVEKLSISVDTRWFCIGRASADEILRVKPQVDIPEFHVIRDLEFTKEQLMNPGFSVRYDLKGRMISLEFSFRKCAGIIFISSK